VNSDGTCDKLFNLNNGHIKGVLGVCSADSEAISRQAMAYWVAAEHEGTLPTEFSTLHIPASRWVVFEVQGAMPEAMQNVWKQIFTEWFPTSGYEHAGTPELEVYPAGDAYCDSYYSEIWIPVK
jgi:AraC family transcriptional regulator